MQSHSSIGHSTLGLEAKYRIKRKEVVEKWEEYLSSSAIDAHMVANKIAEEANLEPNLILAWAKIYGWPITSKRFDSIKDMRVNSEFLSNDARDDAVDPLAEFYRIRSKLGKSGAINRYFSLAGYLNTNDLNFQEVVRLLSKYPLSLEMVAKMYCQEIGLFMRFAASKGLKGTVCSKNSPTLFELLERESELQSVVSNNARSLYYKKAIPINHIAKRYGGIDWKDLWLLGVRFGFWELPSSTTLAIIDDYLSI